MNSLAGYAKTDRGNVCCVRKSAAGTLGGLSGRPGARRAALTVRILPRKICRFLKRSKGMALMPFLPPMSGVMMRRLFHDSFDTEKL